MQVYDHEIGQESVFATTAQPIVDSVLQGYNGTVFAYGQTGNNLRALTRDSPL